ncbi:helicase-related protein [Gordonia amicalis]|uniref:helicase-related protein n=1 Tax=Gordonia amicalis TaxID=89053 RepID=UPI003A80D13E
MLPQVPQSETGLPLTAWASTRVAPARRPDGSVVYIKADHVVAGLEPDTPTEPAPQEEPAASIAAVDEDTTPPTTEVGPATRFTHPGTVLVPSGAKARARANIAALEVLSETARAGRPATAAEHEVLAQWSGWGAAADIFDESKSEWAPEREQLRALLDSEQWRQAKASTLNAHYTDPAIAQAMWSAMARAGFNEGLVLEPGCGSGTFIGLAPPGAQMVGVELDPTTAQIAHLLYPDAQVRLEGFETTRVPDGSFTAVIGNVPFGGFTVHDPIHNPARHRIHNHFLLKSLNLTAPGGYVMAITTAGTLDAASDKARRDMHAVADLVGAVRLPSTAFERVAGTQVVTDVLVFRRREPDAAAPADADWLHSDLVALADRTGETTEIGVNRYFTTHPEHVLGTMRVDRGLYRDGMLVVAAEPGGDVAADLDDRLTGIVDAALQRGDGLFLADDTAPAGMEFTAGALDTDALYGEDTPIGHVSYDETTGVFSRRGIGGDEPIRVPATRATETRHLLRLRDLFAATIAAQRTQSSRAERDALRANLNEVYDAYLNTYGPVNRAKLVGGKERTAEQAAKKFAELEAKWRAAHRDADGADYPGPLPEDVAADLDEKAWQVSAPSRRQIHLEAVRADPGMAGVLALERYDDETGTVSKTAVFSRDVVVAPVPVSHADTPAEAVAISLGERGRVDLDRVAELLDQPTEQARESIRGLVYADPDMPEDLVPAPTALSGNVRAKHARAAEAARTDPGNRDWAELTQALAQVIPTDKQPSQIGSVKLGPTWIEPRDYEAFVRETFGAASVRVSRAAGSWGVEVPPFERNSTVMRTEYGADNADFDKALDAVDLTEMLLNQRSIVVKNSGRAQEEGAPEVDAQATILAQVQAEKITIEFRSWLWSDDERRDRLVAEWNRRFNTWVRPEHDGSRLVLPGLSPVFEPHPYQRDAVARILAEPTVLLDHVVGAGKTGTMFMSAMELKRRGLVTQPWIVVPTHLIEQFGREVKMWYPAANVLVGRKGMSAEDRRVFAAQTATSDWDMVIIPASVFEAIRVHPQRRVDYIANQLADLDAELSAGVGEMTHATVKKIERAKKQLQKRLDAATDQAKKDHGVLFEDTGGDYLFVDEAHEYKNKGRQCAIDSLSLTGSNKAEDLSMKLDYLRERRQHQAAAAGRVIAPGAERVATFATGTPIANSLAESWVMQQYLRPDVLEVAGVRSITDWAASFTATRSETIPNATGTKLRVVSKVSAFANPKEMFAMAAQYTDVVVREQVPANLPTHDGRQIVTSTPGQERQDFIADLDYRADHLDPRRADIDNVLKILNDGRNVALDPVLANLEPDPGNTRADAVAEQVARIYHATADNEYLTEEGERSPIRGALQLVFCDRGTPRPDGPSVYSNLKDLLVEQYNVPAEKIAFIHDARSPSQKLALQADCRAGRIAVLVGSTSKMGTGMNVQGRLIGLHHMDVPWRPADLEQREGRIIRQGNQNPRIEILNYVTAGTTDTVMWSKVESKAAFIEQAKRGQLDDVAEVDDIADDSLSEAAAATKAAATGDERFLEMATLEDEVKSLSALASAHADSRSHARRVVSAADHAIPRLEGSIDKLDALLVGHQEWIDGGKQFVVTGDRSRAQRPERSEALLSRVTAVYHELKGAGMKQSMPIASIPSGLQAHASREFAQDKIHVWLDCPGRPGFTLDTSQVFTTAERRGATASGLATRLENLYAGLDDTRAQMEADIASYRREVEVNAPRIDAPFTRAEELQTKQVRLRQLRMEIEQAQQSEEAVAARQAAEERMRSAGREPGWSLELNPTPVMVEEAGLDHADDYVAAMKRSHQYRAELYQAEKDAATAEPGIGTLLADTRPAPDAERTRGTDTQQPPHDPPLGDGVQPKRDPDVGL